jgi:hypothetical protein
VSVTDALLALKELEPPEIRQLCGDPVFRAICEYCKSTRNAPQLDFGRGDTYDPLSDPLDNPLPEEEDEGCLD